MRISLFFFIFLISTGASLNAQQILLYNLQEAISIDATQSHLFIVEQGKHRILKLNFEGQLLDSLGGLGSGDYQFDTPVDIEASNGLRIYVSDKGNNRIQIYDRRFQYLSTIKAGRGEREFVPEEVVSTLFGEVLFYDARSSSIKVFDENGQERSRFILPTEVQKVDEIKLSDNRMYILDKRQKVVHELEFSGKYRSFFPAEGFIAFNTMKGVLLVSNGSDIQSIDESTTYLEGYPMAIRKIIFVEGYGIYGLTANQLFFIDTR